MDAAKAIGQRASQQWLVSAPHQHASNEDDIVDPNKRVWLTFHHCLYETSELGEWCEFKDIDPETTVLRIYPNEARQLAYLLNQAVDIQDGNTVEVAGNYYTRKI